MSQPNSTTITTTYTTLSTTVTTYFRTIDTHDLPTTLALFSPTATFTITTSNTIFTGQTEIHAMFSDFISRSKTMEHRVLSMVVDERERKVATQQRYIGEMKDGSKLDMFNCNFFEFDEGGLIMGVRVWMDGVGPL
ncbi:hypothetical protein ASPCADRAFT_209097, partial [Aspergillus carbonarius ITEM 5010]